MVSCQILWKSTWKTVLVSCGFCVEKFVEMLYLQVLGDFNAWKTSGFSGLFYAPVYLRTKFCGKRQQGDIGWFSTFSTIST